MEPVREHRHSELLADVVKRADDMSPEELATALADLAIMLNGHLLIDPDYEIGSSMMDELAPANPEKYPPVIYLANDSSVHSSMPESDIDARAYVRADVAKRQVAAAIHGIEHENAQQADSGGAEHG